jgi:hypothetical protein
MFTIDKLDVDYVLFVLFLSGQRYVLLNFKKEDIKEWKLVTINERNKYYEYKVDKRKWRIATPNLDE